MINKAIRDWFILRFGRLPESRKDGYFDEWNNRFRYGLDAAFGHMDNESRKCWNKVADIYNLPRTEVVE